MVATKDWFEAHRDVGFDLMRIYLGIGLFIRGLFFVSDQGYLAELLGRSGQMPFVQTFMLHYIPVAHLGGGLLLALGLLTRVSALFQLPILFGAVFVIHRKEGLFAHGQNVEFTALVLFLLLLLAVYGSGRLSVDRRLSRRSEEPR
jgi:uncharacterized membrane protein YphA (DoxX/SURF4 family)